MSTRAKVAASVASAGVVALGWHHYAGAAPAAAGVAQPVTTTTVTVTKTPSAAPTTGSSPASTTTKAKSTPTTKKSSSSAATTSSSTARRTTRTNTTTTTTSTQTSTAAATGWRDGTYRGQTVAHQYGTVTVTVTISGGRIANLTEQYTDPGDPRSQYIDQQAIPMVKQEVLAADSADVSTIGGATFTSAAYLQSLQSALNQA